MNRPFTLRAKVIDHSRDAVAEQLLPKPVHNGPSCKWVFWRNEPSRQVETGQAAAFRVERLRQKMGDLGLHYLAAFILPIAASQNARDQRFARDTDHGESAPVA